MEEMGGSQNFSAHPQPLWALLGGSFWCEGAGWGEGREVWSRGALEPGAWASSDRLPGQGWGSADAVCPADSSALVPRLERKGGVEKARNILTGVETGRFGRWVICVSGKDYSCPGRPPSFWHGGCRTCRMEDPSTPTDTQAKPHLLAPAWTFWKVLCLS